MFELEKQNPQQKSIELVPIRYLTPIGMYISTHTRGRLCSRAFSLLQSEILKQKDVRPFPGAPGPSKIAVEASSALSPGKQLLVRCLHSSGPGETGAIKNKRLLSIRSALRA